MIIHSVWLADKFKIGREAFYNRCKIDKKIVCFCDSVSWMGGCSQERVHTHFLPLCVKTVFLNAWHFFILSLSAENPVDRNIYYSSCWCLLFVSCDKPSSYFSPPQQKKHFIFHFILFAVHLNISGPFVLNLH